MTLEELYAQLNKDGISEDRYYLHGLFGSPSDEEKLALTMRKGRVVIEYEVYYKERGQKHSVRIFTNETEACQYIYKKLTGNTKTVPDVLKGIWNK